MKFRVFDRKLNDYRNGYYLYQSGLLGHIVNDYVHDDLQIELSTDNFDKSGKEIYEGDVVVIQGFEDFNTKKIIPPMYCLIVKEKINYPLGKFVMVYKYPNDEGYGQMSMIGSNVLCDIVENIHTTERKFSDAPSV